MTKAQDEENKQPSQSEGSEDIGLDKKTIKKIFYGSQILITGVALLIVFLMFFVAWDFTDKIEKTIRNSMEGLCETFTAVESTFNDVEEEAGVLENTIVSVNSSLFHLSSGLEKMADSLEETGDKLRPLRNYGIDVGSEFTASAVDFRNSSAYLMQTASGLSAHREKISDIRNDIGRIKVGVSSQKQTTCDEKNINDIFNSLRLTLVILFLLAVAFVVVLFLNSAAGVL